MLKEDVGVIEDLLEDNEDAASAREAARQPEEAIKAYLVKKTWMSSESLKFGQVHRERRNRPVITEWVKCKTMHAAWPEAAHHMMTVLISVCRAKAIARKP